MTQTTSPKHARLNLGRIFPTTVLFSSCGLRDCPRCDLLTRAYNQNRTRFELPHQRAWGLTVGPATKEKRGVNPHLSHGGAALSADKPCQGKTRRGNVEARERFRGPVKVGRSRMVAVCSRLGGAEELVSRDVSQVVAEAKAGTEKPHARSEFSRQLFWEQTEKP